MLLQKKFMIVCVQIISIRDKVTDQHGTLLNVSHVPKSVSQIKGNLLHYLPYNKFIFLYSTLTATNSARYLNLYHKLNATFHILVTWSLEWMSAWN